MTLLFEFNVYEVVVELQYCLNSMFVAWRLRLEGWNKPQAFLCMYVCMYVCMYMEGLSVVHGVEASGPTLGTTTSAK